MYKLNSWNENQEFKSSKIAQNIVSGPCGSDINTSCCIDTTKISTSCCIDTTQM
ncbi:hypothetical protein [Methanobrevibacter sp.]|uniref:hypothetical protein n=1 Tax=Methanobrevibacter sp. TaxID=66852 RepID=UPI00388D9DAC